MALFTKAPPASRSKRVFLADLVPLTARATFFYDLASSPLTGVYAGMLAMLPWVAKHTLEASDLEIAVLVAAPSAAHLFTVYWAHLMEGRPKMPFVFWPGLVARSLILLVGLALNSVMLVVLTALSYLVGNMATPAYNVILRNNYPGTHRYRAVGAVFTTISAIAFLTSLGVGWLLTHYDERLFRVVIPVGAVCGILAVFIYARIRVRGERDLPSLDDADSKSFSFSGNFGILWRDRKFGKFMLMQFLLGFSNLLTGAVLVSLIKQQNASYLEASLVLSVAPNAAMVLAMPMWGRILQTMSPWRARSILAMIWAVGIILIACSGNSILMVILGQAVVGTSSAGGSLMWSLQQMYFARREDVPQYMGVHCTLTGIRGLIAPFVGVWLMTLWGAHAVFFVAAGGMFCAESIALQMARREHKEAGTRGHVDGAGLDGEGE